MVYGALWSQRVITSTVRNPAAGNHGARAVSESVHLDPQVQDRQTDREPTNGNSCSF